MSFSLELQVRSSFTLTFSLAFVAANLGIFLLTRNRKISTAPSYYNGPQEEACK